MFGTVKRAQYPKSISRFFGMVLLVWILCAFQTQPLNGKYTEKYANGKVSVKGNYKNGQKQGTWMYFDEHGKTTLKEKWKQGELLWKAEYEQGRIARVIDAKGKVIEYPKCGCN